MFDLIEDIAGVALAATGAKKVIKSLEEGDVVGAAVGVALGAAGLGLLTDDDDE